MRYVFQRDLIIHTVSPAKDFKLYPRVGTIPRARENVMPRVNYAEGYDGAI